MKDLRYSPMADEFGVFDWETGEKILGVDIVKRLNKQNALIRQCRKHRDALIEALNEEKENADGELRDALVRICMKELEF